MTISKQFGTNCIDDSDEAADPCNFVRACPAYTLDVWMSVAFSPTGAMSVRR